MQLFSLYFYSIFYYDYQILVFTLHGVIVRSFGRKPVRRTEQNKERNRSFFYIYIYILFFLPFFASSLFRARPSTTPITTLLAGSATYKREMCVLSRLLKNIATFCETANDGSQHLRDMFLFFSRIHLVSSAYVKCKSIDMIDNMTHRTSEFFFLL